MTLRREDRQALDALEFVLKALLPPDYQDTYKDLQPSPMKSAGLKYDADGRVAWGDIWRSFCDLAMAGGPPHKGTLLEAATLADIDADADRYTEVVAEICRGIGMTTELGAAPSPDPGWIRVDCLGKGMAGWLVRAIVMENVSARLDGFSIELPASPHYRLEKEIKNVVTVVAKTCHYWSDHMPLEQQRAIGDLLARIGEDSPLVQPDLTCDDANPAGHDAVRAHASTAILKTTGMAGSPVQYRGWLGVQCASPGEAIRRMRLLVASNVLARREEAVLFVPINPALDPDGDAVIESVIRIHLLCQG